MEFVVNNLKYTTIKYTENDVEVSIDSANGASGDIVVPSTVTYDGSTYNVVKMLSPSNNSTVTSVVLPDSITTLIYSSFYAWSKLESVTFGNGLTQLPETLFNSCAALKSVSFPQNLTLIGLRCFQGCSSIEEIIFPDSLTKIGEYSLNACTKLKHIHFGSAFRDFGDYGYIDSCITGCINLERITVSSGNTKYDSRNNSGCLILTSTNTLLLAGKNSVIPEGVLYLESGCYGCGGWDYQITDSIEIPSSVIGIKGTVCSGGFTGPLSVKMNSTTPPVLASVSCFPANTSIQVPVGRVSSYQAAQYYDTYTVNSRPKITYHLANRIYQEDTYNSGATVVPPQNPDNSYVIFLGWNETIPTVMPDANVSITANYEIINRVRFYPSDFSVLQPHFSIKAEKAGLSLTLVSSTGDCINLGTDLLLIYYHSYEVNLIHFNLSDELSTVQYYAFDSINDYNDGTPFYFRIEPSNPYLDELEEIDGKVYRSVAFLYDPHQLEPSFLISGVREMHPSDKTPRTIVNYIDVFREFKCNVTYVVDGQVYRVVEVRPGSVIPDLSVPAKAHKKAYWNGLPEGSIMPMEDITLTAVYEDYSVTFIAQDVIISQRTYEYGETVTPPTPTVKAHYVFDHWDPTPVSTMTDGDKTYTAIYLGNPHTITYRVDGSVWQVQNVRYDDVIDAPVAPAKRYHTFEGWTPALPETVPDENLVVDAVYEAITYYISYMYDGQEMAKVGYKYNTTVTPPTAALEELKQGYYVSGFDPALPAKMLGYDFSVEVIYDLKTYYITYVVDGVTYKTLGYLYSLPVQVPVVPPKSGYYGFWDNVPSTMPWNDLTVTAVYVSVSEAEIIEDWPIFREKLVRDTDGDVRKGNIIGDTFTRPATIASYNQQGEAYYLDNVAVLLTDTTDTITTNYFYMRFNGTEDHAVDVELPVKTPDGTLHMADWLQSRTANGVIFYLSSEFADTTSTYYLQLEEYLQEVDGEFYQVLTNSVTGTQHKGNLVHVKSEISSWSGQYYQNAYPKWQRNITSADDGRTYVFYIPVDQLTRRDVIVKPAGNQSYHPDFSYGDEPWPYVMYPQGVRLYREYDSDMFEALFEWYDEDDYPIQAMSKEDDAFVIMTAGATSAGDNYTTLWMMSEGVIHDVIRKPAGNTITAWPAYTREGYTFSGVSASSGGSAISLPYTVPAASTKLYILWTAVPTPPAPVVTPVYTLTYKVLGSVYATVEIPSGQSPASYRPANPSVQGYSFTGWSGEPQTVTSDAIVTAQFTQVATGAHTLTYKIGTTTLATMSVKTGDVIPILPYPTKTGYTFDGWSGIPADGLMPAQALTITGSFTKKPDPLAS